MEIEISILQAILIGITFFLGVNATPWLTTLGATTMMRPLFNGLIVGIILGDPVGGTIIGAAINLPFMAFISAGGSMPMDPAFAGTVGTALALATGASPQIAISLAVPIGLLGTVVWITRMAVDIIFVHKADEAAEEGDINRINFYNVVPPQVFLFLISVIPVALAVYFGPYVVQPVLDALEGRPLEVLTLIGGLLPALGIAMNLQAMDSKGTLIFFIFGFLLVTYTGLPMVALAIFAAVFAWIYTQMITDTDESQQEVL